MGYDGKIVFCTKIDNTQVEKDLKQLRKKIQQSEESISKNENAKLPLERQANALKAEIEAINNEVSGLEANLNKFNSFGSNGEFIPDETAQKIASWKDAITKSIEEHRSNLTGLQKQLDSLNVKISTYDTKIQQANADIEISKVKAAELTAQANSGGFKMSQAFAKARTSAEKFRKQILRVGASMIMFRVFSAVLQGISQYMGKVLKTNEEYTAQLAQLKAALATAFQPIYEFILPGLMAVLKVLTSIVSVVANVLSVFSGKSFAQNAKNAETLNKEADALENIGGAAKDAGKSLANFDEINTLSTGSSGGGGGGVAGGEYNFEEFDTAQYKAKIDELTVYLSGALLAIGAILAFSGANVPLGIALMAAGALGIVAVVKENWGKMSDELKGALATVAFLLGGSLLAIGAVLAFSGSNLPLGIALMVAGAISLATAAALNWNSIVTVLRGPVGEIIALVSGALLVLGAILTFSGVNLKLGITLMAVGAFGLVTVTALNWNSIGNALQGPVGTVMAIACGALLALGLILAFSGVNIPLGIALIVAGATGLVTVTAVNWNAVKDKLSEAWEAIKIWYKENVAPKLTLSYWQEQFANIGEGLKQKIKDGINGAIKLFNKFISWVNSKMKFSWDAKYLMGEKLYDAGSIQLFTIPKIPYLAQGAVLPPNKPFMAMVGDQKNGTNIEAPLATIQEALANVLAAQGTGDINITFTGDLAQLARVLKPVIDRENNRVGGSLAKGVL